MTRSMKIAPAIFEDCPVQKSSRSISRSPKSTILVGLGGSPACPWLWADVAQGKAPPWPRCPVHRRSLLSGPGVSLPLWISDSKNTRGCGLAVCRRWHRNARSAQVASGLRPMKRQNLSRSPDHKLRHNEKGTEALPLRPCHQKDPGVLLRSRPQYKFI